MTIFKRILDGEIKADIIYHDDQCIAFRDVNPQAPTHVLIIPREEIASLDDLSDQHQLLVGHLLLVARKLASQLALAKGYRVVINCNANAGQTVFQLHLHLVAGAPLGRFGTSR